jgi:hypothetical protein
MKIRTAFLTLAFCFCALAASFADNPNLGSWKLNEAKSKIPAGVSKNTSVVYTADGDNLKAVVEGVDGSGQPIHNEWTGKFDGKDYPVTGDKITDTRAVQQVDATHFKLTGKKDGKVVTTGTIVTSADGKTRTLNVKAKDASGKAVTATFVYDKQ